jgi:hypothetical protein
MKDKFPNCYNYLLSNKEKLTGREYFEKSNKLWFELWNQRKPMTFNKEKIVTLDNASKNSFALDTANYFGTTTVYSFSSNTTEYSNKYILALINSKLIEFYHKLNSVPQANGFFRYQAIFINSMPIKRISYNSQLPFVELVNEILQAKDIKPLFDTSDIEQKIDNLVYRLYNLTYEEVRVIDHDIESKISEEEYNLIEIE